MSDRKSDKTQDEDHSYFLEVALASLTAVENVLSERTVESKETIHLLKQQYGPEQLAAGAMIVLTALVAHEEDSSGISAAHQVQSLRELMFATMDEGLR